MKDEDLAYMSALARLSGRIETMKKFDDEVSTERLKEKFNQDLERAGVESETFKVE